jgi:hypothetical protein
MGGKHEKTGVHPLAQPGAFALWGISLLFLLLPLRAGGTEADTSFRGPLPKEQQDLIRDLARFHDRLTRRVVLTDSGYEAQTTTSDPELARKLKAHVAYMKKRLASGAMVRRWDPAFDELIQYHDQLEVTVEDRKDGIAVVVRGSSPEAIRVARNHARIVSGFVEKGPEAVQTPHSPALKAPNE